MDLLYNLAINIEPIKDVEASIVSLLDLLDIGQPDLTEGCDKLENTKWLIHLGHLYGSRFATSFVANSLQQIVVIRYPHFNFSKIGTELDLSFYPFRYELTRCLLIFERMLVRNSFRPFIDSERLSRVDVSILERTSSLIQCYYVLIWMTQTPVYLGQSPDYG